MAPNRDVERLVDQAVEQGHPRVIDDPDVLRRIAAMIRRAAELAANPEKG